MLNKLQPKPQANKRQITQEKRSEDEQVEIPVQVTLVPRSMNKTSLFVTFSGELSCGSFSNENSLIASCEVVAGPDWLKLNGSSLFTSQIGAIREGKLLWNLPFEFAFESTSPAGWPQLALSFKGTDFFGRFFCRGYANCYLPLSAGRTTRTLQVFRPLPQSLISGLFGYVSGCVSELKNPSQTLTSGDGREVLRVENIGEVTMVVDTHKFNFERFGFD